MEVLENKVKLALLSMQRHSWEQGVAMQAFWEAEDTQTACALAKEAVYRSMDDGRAATLGVFDAVTDSCSVGEVLLWAARKTGDKELEEGAYKLLQWALVKAPRNREGVVYHLIDKKEFWADSMYMLPPFLAAAGYYKEAVVNIEGYWKALFDQEACLMCHIWDDERKICVRKKHWGVGNGWVLAGMARVIALLPKEMYREKDKLVKRETILIKNILRYRREDYFFHDIIDDPGTFVETNLAQMLSYTIYRGIAGGWLDQNLKSEADSLRQAAEEKVDCYGFVKDVCGAPTFDKPGIAPEGNAFYILMEAAAKKVI